MKHHIKIHGRPRLPLLALCLPAALAFQPVQGAPITWIGLDNDWLDGGSTAYWSPADEPDSDDIAIFDTANAVSMGSNNTIAGLTMTDGIDLFTETYFLDVNGNISLSGASTSLGIGANNIIGVPANALDADNITIGSGATLHLGGSRIDYVSASGSGLVSIATGGTLQGNGTLLNSDALAAATNVLVNDGTLSVGNYLTGLVIVGTPVARTLTVSSTDADARVDLDGPTGAGAVSIGRNQTLDMDVTLSDAMSGNISLSHNSTLDVAAAWSFDSSTLTADNGFVAGVLFNPDIPADTSYINGGTLTQTGGTILVADTDGTLEFNAPFTMNGGALTNNGLVVFNNSATIGASANFTMPENTSSITVGAGNTVTVNQANFNPDGNGAGTNKLTIGDNAILDLNLGVGADTAIGGIIRIEGGLLDTTTSTGTWSIDGDIEIPTGFSASGISGDPVTLTSVGVSINGTGLLLMSADTTLSTATAISGNGELVINRLLNIPAATTINMSGGIVDLDGTDGTGDFINIDAPLTINAATMRSFGKVNGGGGTNTLDVNNSAGTGVLTVNLDNPAGAWTLNGPGVMNLVNDNTAATLLAGSDAILNGTVNITGDVITTARVDIAGTVNINTVGEPFRLNGGTLETDPNGLLGGTISGAGLFNAASSYSLHGFGTINTSVDFDGTAMLLADNGTLTVNGAIVDVGTIGTADADGTLNVVNAWNSNVSASVLLDGGVLAGGIITNDAAAGIAGHGLVSARVINNSKLTCGVPGQTLVFQTIGNDNDWDGAGNTGNLTGSQGILEIRDIGAAFAFGGSVTADQGGEVYTNGFGLNLNSSSSISLSNGTFHSTHTTYIGGGVTVGPQPGTIFVENNVFLVFEPTSVTTLNADLTLQNNNINIEAGAVFGGTGAVIIPDGSHLVTDPNANINTLLDLEGALRIANSEGIGRTDVKDYQQGETGELYVELTGTALNAFDRLVVNGVAVIDGYLNIDLDGGFVPVAGNTFVILSTSSGVFGKFDYFDVSGLPPGLSFKINYLANSVQLEVVTGSTYDQWINSFVSLVNPADKLKTADPDGDGMSNEGEFALDGDPTSGASSGKIVGKIAPVAGVNAMTLTFPVRTGSVPVGPGLDPAGGQYSIFRPDDTLVMYTIQATDDLITYPLEVTEVTGADATAIQAGLPAVHHGWTYRTFRSPGAVAGDPREFMRAVITVWPNVP